MHIQYTIPLSDTKSLARDASLFRAAGQLLASYVDQLQYMPLLVSMWLTNSTVGCVTGVQLHIEEAQQLDHISAASIAEPALQQIQCCLSHAGDPLS